MGSSLLAFHRNPASQHRQTHFAEVSLPNKAEGERHQPADKRSQRTAVTGEQTAIAGSQSELTGS